MATDTMKNTKHPLFLCLWLLIYLALASCSTPTYISGTTPTAAVDERHIEEIMATGRPLAAVRYLDQRSINAQPAEQAELKLRSIEILFDQGYPELASSRLHTLEGTLIKPSLMNRYKILQAQSFLLQSQPAEALKVLPAISGNMSTSTQVRLLKTKALAQENAFKGITVNAICPGYIGTEMVLAVPEDVLKEKILPHIPVGRLGEPEEIARCVVFLASDDAGFITGSTLSAQMAAR